jgi:hypothetical protein
VSQCDEETSSKIFITYYNSNINSTFLIRSIIQALYNKCNNMGKSGTIFLSTIKTHQEYRMSDTEVRDVGTEIFTMNNDAISAYKLLDMAMCITKIYSYFTPF